MVAKRKRSTTVFSEPAFEKISPLHRDYKHQLWKLDFFCSQEMNGKELKKETVKWLRSEGKDRAYVSRVNSISDGFFCVVGKYFYALNNGAQLKSEDTATVLKMLEEQMPNAPEKIKEASPILNKKPVASIQDAMWTQVEPLVNELDEAIDKRTYNVDVYKLLTSNENAKAAQIRLVKAYFVKEREYIESNEEAEAYSHYTAPQLKKLVKFLNDIEVACDTIISSYKQKRTPRQKKPTPATKIVEKVKYLKSNVELGLVSLNPIDVLDCSLLWYYNEKKRKLGYFETDEFNTAISFKGTSVIGYATAREKTVRNPEAMKGFQKFSKAKMLRFYNDLKTKEGTPSPRTNTDMILLKKW